MHGKETILRDTAVIALGEVIGSAVMVAVFALLGYYDRSVLLGAIAGSVLATLNFFFMALGLLQAAQTIAQADNPKGGKMQARFSYSLRMLVMFVILFALIYSGLCQVLASVIPLLFVRVTIMVREFFRKPEEDSHES